MFVKLSNHSAGDYLGSGESMGLALYIAISEIESFSPVTKEHEGDYLEYSVIFTKSGKKHKVRESVKIIERMLSNASARLVAAPIKPDTSDLGEY